MSETKHEKHLNRPTVHGSVRFEERLEETKKKGVTLCIHYLNQCQTLWGKFLFNQNVFCIHRPH